MLEAGDSISFASTTPHRLANVGDVPVHAIWCVVGRDTSPTAPAAEPRGARCGRRRVAARWAWALRLHGRRGCALRAGAGVATARPAARVPRPRRAASSPRVRSPTPALADSTPIGPLPMGPVATITTHRGLFVAVALPHPADKGNVWRLARRVDSKILRQVSEADVGKNVVVVYQVTGKGSGVDHLCADPRRHVLEGARDDHAQGDRQLLITTRPARGRRRASAGRLRARCATAPRPRG